MQYDYSKVLSSSYSFYNSQMIGNLPANFTPSWRASALTYEADPYGSLAGGFVAGAGAGTVKLSLPIAYSTAILAWSAVQFPKVPDLFRRCSLVEVRGQTSGSSGTDACGCACMQKCCKVTAAKPAAPWTILDQRLLWCQCQPGCLWGGVSAASGGKGPDTQRNYFARVRA